MFYGLYAARAVMQLFQGGDSSFMKVHEYILLVLSSNETIQVFFVKQQAKLE